MRSPPAPRPTLPTSPASSASPAPGRPRRALLCALVLVACTAPRPAARQGVLSVFVEQQAGWVHNFNPLTGGARWPTAAGIYEPLLVHSAVRGGFVPWLATTWAWEDEAQTLSFKLRPGVLWSDGTPFTSADVASPSCCSSASPPWIAAPSGASSPRSRTTARASASASRAPTPQASTASHASPSCPPTSGRRSKTRFASPTPSRSAPAPSPRSSSSATRSGSSAETRATGRPAGPPSRPCASSPSPATTRPTWRWPRASSTGPATSSSPSSAPSSRPTRTTAATGSRSSARPSSSTPTRPARPTPTCASAARSAWPSTASSWSGSPCTATPAPPTAPASRTPSRAGVTLKPWPPPGCATTARPRALLAEAGYRVDPGGMLRGPDGEHPAFEITVVSGWSDWVRAAQVIARDLRVLGIEVSVRTLDFSPWFEKVQSGDFDLAIGWSTEGAAPYAFYRWLMSAGTLKPIGTPAAGNWHRYASPAANRLLTAFERTTDEREQRRLARELQRVFADELPAIPLFPNPSWGAFNTTRFTGFPSAAEPYAQLSPNPIPECLLVLTRLEPRPPAQKVR